MALRSFASSVMVLALLVGVSPARAQQVDLVRMSPATADSPALTIESASVPVHTRWSLGVAFDYAHARLDRKVDCSTASGAGDSACTDGNADGHAPTTQDVAKLDLLVAVALFGSVRVGLDVPLLRAARLPEVGSTSRGSSRYGLGDMRLSLIAPLLRAVFPLAFVMGVTLPTASDDALQASRLVTLAPTFVLQKVLGPVTVSAAAGFLTRRHAFVVGHEQDDALSFALAAACALPWTIELVTEARTLVGVAGRGLSGHEVPMEVDVALRFDAIRATRVTLGAGTGSTPLAEPAESSVLRLFAAVRGSFGDTACTTGPEDFDGMHDDDACADVDDDSDGLLDVEDRCPRDTEDRDGFADDDGCPDFDNDADGVLDAADVCPNRSEDRDGYQDRDGCPEPDNDGDGVVDGLDLCRLDPEDGDAFQDDDGCPEPGPARTTITVEGARVLLSDRIYFDDDADTLRAVSTPVLDELAAVLPELLQNKRLRVVGHTDDSGGADYNLDLSYRRAKAVVEYLKAHGVAAERLEHVGRGAAEPLAPNDTIEGRALNRRVELLLIDVP